MFNIILYFNQTSTYVTTIIKIFTIDTTLFQRSTFTYSTYLFLFSKVLRFSSIKYMMTHPTRNIVPDANFCYVCNLSFKTKKGLYRHQSNDLKHKKLLEKILILILMTAQFMLNLKLNLNLNLNPKLNFHVGFATKVLKLILVDKLT